MILAAHNKLRSMIAMGQYGAMGKMFVGASNMEKMVRVVTDERCIHYS